MHIIYIEDDPTNIALVERVVRMAQDTLTTYVTAEDASIRIQPDDADLILRIEPRLRGEAGAATFVIEKRAAIRLSDLPTQPHAYFRFETRLPPRHDRLHLLRAAWT